MRVCFKLACSSESGGPTRKRRLLYFLRAQTTATQQSNKGFRRLFLVFLSKMRCVGGLFGAFVVVFCLCRMGVFVLVCFGFRVEGGRVGFDVSSSNYFLKKLHRFRALSWFSSAFYLPPPPLLHRISNRLRICPPDRRASASIAGPFPHSLPRILIIPRQVPD